MTEVTPLAVEKTSSSNSSLWYWASGGAILLVAVSFILVGQSKSRNWRERQVREFSRRCRALRVQQDWIALADLSKQWERLEPSNATPILFQAEAAQAQSDFLGTADLLARIPEKNAKRIPAQIERTALLFGPVNRPLEAVAACHGILAQEPRSFAPRQRLIYFYALTLQRAEMLREIEESLEYHSEPLEAYVYLLLADDLTFQDGFDVNNRWLIGNPDQETFLVARTIHMWKNLSQELSKTNDTKERLNLALQLLTEYLDRYPRNLSVLTFFCDLALLDGDTNRMAELLARVSPDCNDSRFWRFRGWLLAAKDDYPQAALAYRKSLQLFPLSWITQHELADVLRRQRAFTEVQTFQSRSLLGKALRQELLQISNARVVSNELLARILTYARDSGAQRVAETLQHRLANFTNEPNLSGNHGSNH